MTYEEKYKQALKVAKKELQACGDLDCDAARQIFRLFPELKEDEDEKIRKELIEFVKSRGGFKQEYITWLEKQGEQNTDDKVEPKFKVGDWLQYRNAKPFLVEEVNAQGYVSGDSCLPFEWENEIHLWTIQDAKDGDVLLSPSTPEGDKECPFIFKEIDKDGIVRSYVALLQSEHLKIADGITNVVGYANAGYHTPATKEQRDLLFQKMKEAGYEWDAEKKELKKVELKACL